MMRVDRVTSTPDAYRQSQFYAGTHLALYDPTLLKNRAKVITKVENGIFERYLEKENTQRTLLTASSTKEKLFLEKRLEHADREELVQQLNYKNGVHYSVHQLQLQQST